MLEKVTKAEGYLIYVEFFQENKLVFKCWTLFKSGRPMLILSNMKQCYFT